MSIAFADYPVAVKINIVDVLELKEKCGKEGIPERCSW